jgi:hypothetical protein
LGQKKKGTEEAALPDFQLLLGFGAHHAGLPGRVPDEIDGGLFQRGGK